MIYMSAQYLTSGLVALCFSTVTVMNILNQATLFKIPFNRKVFLGTVLELIGMILTQKEYAARCRALEPTGD